MKRDRKVGLVLAVATLILAENARAGSGPASEQPAPAAGNPDHAGETERPPHWGPLSRFGMTIAAGGGVTEFTQSSIRDVTDTGASWDFRLGFETRRWVGFELSYIGGANTLHSLGLAGNDTRLIRNGIEGALRLNAPLYARNTLLEPYVAGGVGWNGYRITNLMTATASVSPSGENSFSVPLAIGFAVGYKGFIADARYTFRPTYKQSTLRDEGSGALTNWDFGGMLGFEF